MKSNQVYNTVRTSTNNTNKGNKSMTKIQIALNISTSSVQGINEERATVAHIHNGAIRYRRDTMKAFISFNPTPIKEEAKFTPVFKVDADGNRTELDRVEFWAAICGTDEEGNVKASTMSAQLDESAREVISMIKSGAKSLIFTFNIDEAGTAFVHKGAVDGRIGNQRVSLASYRFGPSVSYDYEDFAVISDQTFINSDVVANAIKDAASVAPCHGISNINAVNTTVSSTKSVRRRPARKVAAQVAQQPSSQFDDFFAAPATPHPVTAPSVDVEKEALRKENAELKTQVAELSANVAQLTSMMQQFMATQTTPASVVDETPAEPEVETSPQVEAARESVASTPAPQSMDDLLAILDEEEETVAFHNIYGSDANAVTNNDNNEVLV